MIRKLASFALWLILFPALVPAQEQTSTREAGSAQNVETPAVPVEPPEPQKPATVRVNLKTSEGTIVLELEKERAPITTANFLRYVDKKQLDGTTFYRASKSLFASQIGLIQGGAGNDPKRMFPPIKHEPTTVTGLTHDDGAISMARSKPGTAAGDFFIIVGGMTGLDANPKESGDNLGFAAFGHVVEGMDVVRRILAAPISFTKGEGVMRGEMIANPVKIISVRRAPSATPPLNNQCCNPVRPE